LSDENTCTVVKKLENATKGKIMKSIIHNNNSKDRAEAL